MRREERSWGGKNERGGDLKVDPKTPVFKDLAMDTFLSKDSVSWGSWSSEWTEARRVRRIHATGGTKWR